jgi:hypothetical protein
MRGIICGSLVLLAAFALPVLGQTAAGANSQVAPCKVTPTPVNPSQRTFTAELKTTEVKTLANGATITREYTQVQARDSQSRFMSTYTQAQQHGDHTPMTSVNVQDTAAGTQTSWNSQAKKATILKEPPPEQRHGCWQSESGSMKRRYPDAQARSATAQAASAGNSPSQGNVAQPTIKQPHPVFEDLGTMTIQGVEARGQRYTTTTPVGEIGNDQPLVSTQENWNAVGLGITVRQVSDDPQQGKRTTELVKLDRGEPDPALFQPPEGYEIVTDEMVPCKQP